MLITMRHPVLPLAAIAVALAAAAACSESTGEVPAQPTSGQTAAPTAEPTTPSKAAEVPKLTVEEVAGGLDHGWDVGFLPNGKVLVTQRPARIALLSSAQPGATVTEVNADLSDVHVRGEGGLMGMVVHQDFATSRRFTTCQTHRENGRPADVRLVTWRLSPDDQTATRERELVTGLPINPSGRHSGCRPAFADDGSLLVGTGDTASNPTISQDLNNLGGKVLRLDVNTGQPAAGNPTPGSLVYTFGHRNVQGVAPRPDSDQVFVAEHGPDKNDEVNLLRPGANYGWDPSRGGANTSRYDESVPMTDLQRFPDAVPAKWQSGDDTEAICAAEFLSGPQWGALDGALVVTALRGAKLLVLTLNEAGDVTSVAIPPEFDDTFGRLRAARLGPDGALYVTTTNGEDSDKLLRVTPS
jgi:glucose/arabinose dehydrogenase